MNKQQMMMQLQAYKGMYDQQILETEQLRRRAMATQMALLACLAEAGGSIEVSDDVIEAVQMEEWVGWNSSEGENGLIFTAVEAEVEDEDE